ncbi:hypothetical protein IV203_003882 [Nitzschia inconspicua]|uniref:Uncharacterized protein n=1 Tax=Nitzschia inconspicua TaxID=303405 RepID=A0A9K3L4A8_9STRA|nr:hypothetical protein IV203_003882 [Nitzschia inconspicua]
MVRSAPRRYSFYLSNTKFLALLVAFYVCSLSSNRYFLCVRAEEQVTWTPSDDADDEPSLPLSLKMRKQLLQLHQAISQADDPVGMLEQVAAQNQMSGAELGKMLEKNYRDLQQDPSLLQPKTLPRAIFKALASLGVMVSQLAKKHPRSFGLSALTLILICYTLFVVPRTGLQMSSSKGLLSKGPTTMFSPPDRYVKKLLRRKSDDDRSGKPLSLSIRTVKTEWDDLLTPLQDEEDGVQVHVLPRKHELRQAISAQYTLSPDELLEEFPLGGATKAEIKQERDYIVDMLVSNAEKLLEERNFIEFSSTTSGTDSDNGSPLIRNVILSDDDDGDGDNKKVGVLVVRGLGDFGRHGLLFYKVTNHVPVYSDADDDSSSLTVTTLKNMGFFDGQIHIHVKRLPDHDGMLLVQVSLAVPKGGRRISNTMGQFIVSELARSILQSSSRRTKQTLARKSQNRRYKASGQRRANERRQTRTNRERLLEEMAEDRRRRWQRANPNAGSYRPSNRRQMSPNNC